MALRVVVSALALLASCSSAEVTQLESDDDFEATVLADTSCWAVLFTSKSRDEDAKSVSYLMAFEGLAAGPIGDMLKFGRADVDNVKALCSEFNVRKRMVPRLVLFTSRARMVEVLRLEDELTADALEVAIRSTLASNIEDTPQGDACASPEGGPCRWRKHTLAIGGKDEM